MKIVYLAKRIYMRHDVIKDRYARLYELPMQLSCRGHQVVAVCLSYTKKESGRFTHTDCNEQTVPWYSFNAGPLFLGIFTYLRGLLTLSRSFKPDIIMASSDVLHVIVASMIAKILKIPYVVDLYDNYESFGMAKIPGLRYLYRRALRKARLISVVSRTLQEHVQSIFPSVSVLVLESTINPGVFRKIPKDAARKKFELDANKPIIGTAGALHRNRGIKTLYDAFILCVRDLPDLQLVLAGNTDPGCPPPEHPNITYLGQISHNEMPDFFSSLDIAIICMIDTPFGRYAFPQKAYEILSCETPIIAADIGALKHTLSCCPKCLYSENVPGDLAEKIMAQLEQPDIPDIKIPSWETQGEILDQALRNISV